MKITVRGRSRGLTATLTVSGRVAIIRQDDSKNLEYWSETYLTLEQVEEILVEMRHQITHTESDGIPPDCVGFVG